MYRLWAACTAVLVCLVFGTMSVSGQDATPGAPSPSPIGGTVSLTVRQSGASGDELAAMLFRPDAPGHDGLGSYTVDVTSDPFEDTGDIREGSPWLDERPMSERPVAVVAPGTYRLVIWIGQDLGPYGEWVPAAPIEAMCSIDLTVSEGMTSNVTVSVPPGDGSRFVSDQAACETLPRALTISSDLAFAASAPDLTMWSPPLLDVYAPEDAQGLPLVVMLPPHSLTKTGSAALTQLANAVAAQGAVVVVTNWSQLADPPNTFDDASALEEIARLGQSYAGCAVSFAVSHAAEYGADPSRLVIVGQLFGGNTASMIALGSPDPFPGCEATADWEATGLVAWDTDWLVAMPAWDRLGPDAARAVDALSPWSMLGEAPRIPVALVVSDAWVAATQRCDDRDADWMAWRDPSGSMRERLDEVGAYDDGCQGLGDAAAAMAKQLTAAGFPAEVVRLTDSDLAPLIEAIVKVAQAPIG